MSSIGSRIAVALSAGSCFKRFRIWALLALAAFSLSTTAYASFPAITQGWGVGDGNNLCVLGGSLVNPGPNAWDGVHCTLYQPTSSAGADAACASYIAIRGGTLDPNNFGRWIYPPNDDGRTQFYCRGLFGRTVFNDGSTSLGTISQPFCSVVHSTLSGTSCNCDLGFLQANGVCTGGKNNGQPSCKDCPPVGNPVNPASGNKIESQVVYRGLRGFEFVLTFNTFDYSGSRFSAQWRDSFDRKVAMDGADAMVYRANGQVFKFVASGGSWSTDADTSDRLLELKDAGGVRTGWQLTSVNGDEVETFDVTGRLLAIASREGLTQTLTYSDGTNGSNGGVVLDANGNPTGTVLPAGLLIRAADHFGRVLAFGYNGSSRVIKMTDPAGGIYRFGYVNTDKLGSITFPDSKVRTYVYNEPTYTGGANLPRNLTGIVDENNDRFATFSYDANERALSTEHAGGAERYTMSYSTGATTVTNAFGAQRVYANTTVLGAFKNTGITGAVCPECGAASQTFDANGNISTRVDWNGNRTNYQFDVTRNLETQRVEGLTSAGATTAQTRTISTQWDATFRLPTVIAEPLRITTNTYDPDGTQCGARGALCSRTVQGTSDASGAQGFAATAVGSPRTWTYTYNANGSVLTVDGPRTDVSDVTTYTYYPNDDTDPGRRGNVATIRNALNQITDITSYNAHGQPLTIVDPNGLTTTLTYDARQRLTSRSVGGELTSYDYDGVGQLKKVTLPDGSFLSYTYDAAHRLTAIQDNLGNLITYTLDAMGNRTQEQVFDPANTLAQTRSRVYSNLNRLFQELGAVGQTTEYTYDDQGNVTSVKDPLLKVTSNQYDALNRLKQVTQPGSVVTQYAYNGLDALTQVTDPRGLVTGYTVDGLGNLTLQASPDTGNTQNTYDAAGNLLTQTDAKSQVTTYAYDALNRVTLITFNDGSKQAYAYDQGANGIGRLSSITETDAANVQTSLIQYAYDQHGRVDTQTHTFGGTSYVVGFDYDSFGRLSGMAYPSGRTVTYGFDALGRVNAVSTTMNGTTTAVVQDVQYQPFGGVKSFTLGNGQVYSRTYDQDGRIASYTLGNTNYSVGYDAASRITGIGANVYGYDDLHRLTSAVVGSSSYSYSYDGVGNRLSKTVGASTDTYNYSPSSNRLATITPGTGSPRNFVFDSNGSTTNDGVNTYAYDTRGRMMQATSSVGTTTYQVNALGQRVRKTNSSGDTLFHYDAQGKLIAEFDPGGTVKREIIYLGDMPVGVVQ